MRPSQISRGGAPVGFLSELDPIESTAITYLRLWCQSLEAQDAIARDFEIVFGQTRGKEITDSFEALCKLCVENGRRPLMRHGLECKCFGADESCFANFIFCFLSFSFLVRMRALVPTRRPLPRRRNLEVLHRLS